MLIAHNWACIFSHSHPPILFILELMMLDLILWSHLVLTVGWRICSVILANVRRGESNCNACLNSLLGNQQILGLAMLYKIMHVMIAQIQICDSALLIVSENVVPKQSPEIKREKNQDIFLLYSLWSFLFFRQRLLLKICSKLKAWKCHNFYFFEWEQV